MEWNLNEQEEKIWLYNHFQRTNYNAKWNFQFNEYVINEIKIGFLMQTYGILRIFVRPVAKTTCVGSIEWTHYTHGKFFAKIKSDGMN